MNIIKTRKVWKNSDVKRIEDWKSWMLRQPDKPKDKLELFHFWSEKKRSGISDNATIDMLVLDYDDSAPRSAVEKQFSDYEYVIYNSSGNDSAAGVEKFRVIIKLASPVKASDIRHWRRKRDFVEFFKGVDDAAFSIGQPFCRPSKYDKGGDEVVVKFHSGKPFDFYERWPHVNYFAPFEELKSRLQSKQFKPAKNAHPEWLEEWVDRKYPNGLHYSDICAFALRARSCGVAESEAENIFANHYAGNSSWRKNFRSVYRNPT